MSGFQKSVKLYPAVGVPGQEVNPGQAIYTAENYISDGTLAAGGKSAVADVVLSGIDGLTGIYLLPRYAYSRIKLYALLKSAHSYSLLIELRISPRKEGLPLCILRSIAAPRLPALVAITAR